jgi:cytochrome c-type biogenesis protein
VSAAVVLAGVLLLVAGFVVMAPCQLQMAATLTTVLRRTAALRSADGTPEATVVRPAALRFAAGYIAFYTPVAVVLGAAAWLLDPWAWVLIALGGAGAIVLGLATLGRLRPRWLSRCRGPLYLLRSGRASFDRPFGAGVAFGQYCASCCGPYVYALVVLAGGTGEPLYGAGLVLLYALTMVVPFLLPVLLAPATFATVGERMTALAPRLGRATGSMLVGVGVLLLPVAGLVALG